MDPLALIHEEQLNLISEALKFIGLSCQGIEVSISETNIVTWEAAFDPPLEGNWEKIAGQYRLGDSDLAHLSVIMSVGMMKHRYSVYIYEAITYADRYLLQDAARNSLLELCIRAAVLRLMTNAPMPLKDLKEMMDKIYHWNKNIEDGFRAFNIQEGLNVTKRNLAKGKTNGKP